MSEPHDTEMADPASERPHSKAEYAARRRERQADRSRRRRAERRRALATTAVGAAALGVVVGVAWIAVFGVAQFGAVGRAGRLLDDVDRIIAQSDAAIARDADAQDAEVARGIAERVPGAHALLVRSARELESVGPPVTWAWSRPRNLKAALAARKAMLVPAPALLEIAAQSSSAAPLGRSGWEAIERALAEASATVPPKSGASEKRLTACVAAADGVAGDLNLAQQGFAAAQAAFPDADFEPYLSYITLLQKANRSARQESRALLEGDAASAAAARSARTKMSKRADDARKALALPVSAAIESAVTSVSGRRLTVYERARAQAVEADRRLGRNVLAER